MITRQIDLELQDDNKLYFKLKRIYFLKIRIFKDEIRSRLPIDIENCYPETNNSKMGFKK